MLHFSARAAAVFSVFFGLCPVLGLAQALSITGMLPAANARAAAPAGPVTVSFNQPLTTGSAGALQVFGNQRGGRRTAAVSAVVSGSTLSFAPAASPFAPGETVQATVTKAATGSGGALAQPKVVQFTAAVGGTGQGNFLPSAVTPDVVYSGSYNGSGARGYGAFDFDGDGDLDLVVPTAFVYGSCESCSGTTQLNFFVNDGTGRYTAMAPLIIGSSNVSAFSTSGPINVSDVDGDGDLDFMVSGGRGTWFLNNGSGTFARGNSSGADGGNYGYTLEVGDVDGDGDLDVVGVGFGTNGSLVQLNNGAGAFTTASTFTSTATQDIALGDIDGDGDLDLVGVNLFGVATVHFNNGAGGFTSASASTNVNIGPTTRTLELSDIDGDGDLDLLTANNSASGTVSVRINNGSGSFSAPATGAEVAVGGSPWAMALGDMDGDGDLDLMTANTAANGGVSVRLNDGGGIFLPPPTNANPAVNGSIGGDRTCLRDIDGDGDLDMLLVAYGKISILLNQPNGVLAATRSGTSSAFALAPNPARSTVALTGTAAQAAIEVFDALGRMVLTARANAAGVAQLALPDGLPAGLYLVRSGSQVRRLVVE